MKFYLLFFALCVVIPSMAQNYSLLANSSFESPEDYQKAEPQILEAATYLLSTPVTSNRNNRNNAFQFIFKWMEGTPDYTFSLDKEVMDLTKGNSDLLTLYLVSAVKTVLDQKENPPGEKEIHRSATHMLVEYCSHSENGLKPNRPIRRLMKEQ